MIDNRLLELTSDAEVGEQVGNVNHWMPSKLRHKVNSRLAKAGQEVTPVSKSNPATPDELEKHQAKPSGWRGVTISFDNLGM